MPFRRPSLSEIKPRLIGHYSCEYRSFIDKDTGEEKRYYERDSPFTGRRVHWPVPPYPETERLSIHEVRIMCKTLHIQPADFGADVP